MATDVTDDDITIVDAMYNIKLKDAISEKFIRGVSYPNILMRILQNINSDVLIDVDIDYVKTKLEKDGRMAANEALLDRLYRYKNWFQCLLQAVNDDSIKLGFLEKEFQACKDDLDEQILAETNEETKNSSRHPDNRIPVSQRRENWRVKLNIEKLKRQQDDVCKNFEVQMKELQNELQLLKEVSANQKKEQSRRLDALTLSQKQLKQEFIQEKISHDELKIYVKAQANENMEREKKSTETLNERLLSLNMENEELKSEIKLLTQELALPTSLRRFLHLNSDTGTCYVSEQWKQVHHSGLTLMLIGLTGHGKSATGNTILGRRAFHAHVGPKTIEAVGIECCEYSGINLKLVDGPGLFDTGDDGFFHRFISNIGATLGHGVDVFIYVYRRGNRFTKEQKNGIALFKKNFGADFFRNFCVFLFTHCPVYDKEYEEATFSEYCSNLPEQQKQLIDECGGAVLFENVTKDVNVKERQMESLLYLIAKKIEHRRLSDFKIPSEVNFRNSIPLMKTN